MRRTRSALVTGATGFIGDPLCRALVKQGVHVSALGRNPCAGPWRRFHVCDLGADPVPAESVDGIDTVFHLAARVHQRNDAGEARDCRRINVAGTRKLLEASARTGVSRFLFFSSVKATGEGSNVLVDEATPPKPVSAYGKAKLEAENLVLDAARDSAMSATILRLPLVYGAGVKGNLGEMITAVAAGRFPPIAECGNRRAMVHVSDVVAAALLAAESEVARGKTYIVTDGRDYSTRQIYDAIRRALGKPPAAWSVPVAVLRVAAAAGDTMEKLRLPAPIDSARLQKLLGSARYDGRRICNELGFRPRESFDSALPGMIAALGKSARIRGNGVQA